MLEDVLKITQRIHNELMINKEEFESPKNL